MNINIIFIIAQVIGFIAFIFSLIAYHKKSKSNILFFSVLSNVFNLIHYVLLGANSGCITKVMGIIRDTFIIAKEKNKVLANKYFLICFIIIYIILAFVLYVDVLSIFPIIAALIYIINVWDGSAMKVKKTVLFCYLLWLGYNIFVFSIAGIISNTISIISTFIAIKKFKKI